MTNNTNASIPYNPTMQQIVACKMGDVTGDRFLDSVCLTATKTSSSIFLENITLVIRNGRTQAVERFSLQENAGYNPTIWLGDFTGNRVLDILITIDSGGSGGIIFAYIFSSINGQMKEIFNSVDFSSKQKYSVDYANNYRANITSFNTKKIFTVDLQYKGQDYLSEIYNSDGTLKAPIEGWVDPISALYPIPFRRTGQYDLLAMQQIAGRYHADGLGYVEDLLQWNGQLFEVNRQTVAIYGKEL